MTNTADWSARIIQGDCIAVMAAIPDETIDAIVTDPPYGIEFMGKDWDKFIPHDEIEMSPRWKNAQRSDPTTANWGDGESAKFGKLPSFGGKRSSYQCQTCGKRDAFRNPHKCGDKADWRQVPSYAGASPDVLAFEQFSKAWATEAYRILKPGGHLLAFGATRMYHRLASGIEDAGFEIRDSLHWIYGSGFPKSLDVSKSLDKKAGADREIVGQGGSSCPFIAQGEPCRCPEEWPSATLSVRHTPETAAASPDARQWDGWGTALKPAHEPVVMARKPLSGTVAETVLAHGTGAINIVETRVGTSGGTTGGPRNENWRAAGTNERPSVVDIESIDAGRWPANVLLGHLAECEGVGPDHTDVLCADGCPVAELNEASGVSTSTGGQLLDGSPFGGTGASPGDPGYGDTGGAARFFYIAKPRKREKVGGTIRNLHPCLSPESLVVTERGYQEIASVQVGDRVLADDGRFREVLAAFPTPCDAPIYTVEVEQSNLRVRATGNHPFLVWRPERKRGAIIGGQAGWVEASEVEVGDYTMTPLPTEHKTTDDRSLDWWWMAGLWLAEGSTLRNGSRSSRYPVFSLADHETAFVDRLRSVFGEVSQYDRDDHGITVVAFAAGAADELQRLCGSGARSKVLAPEVLGLDEERRRAFFNGYTAGDGCEMRGGIAAKTSSRALAPQLALLGESLGYRTCLYEFKDERPRSINGRAITANGPYYQIFFNAGERLTRPRFLDHEGQRFSLRRVKSVTSEPYRGDVWNLTIADAHTFQTAVGMTHNTVKPVELMRYLVRMVTPPGGVVLDPFVGSGTTGCAAMAEGFRFVGIEQDPDSYETALARVSDWAFAHGRERPTGEIAPPPADEPEAEAPPEPAPV